MSSRIATRPRHRIWFHTGTTPRRLWTVLARGGANRGRHASAVRPTPGVSPTLAAAVHEPRRRSRAARQEPRATASRKPVTPAGGTARARVGRVSGRHAPLSRRPLQAPSRQCDRPHPVPRGDRGTQRVTPADGAARREQSEPVDTLPGVPAELMRPPPRDLARSARSSPATGRFPVARRRLLAPRPDAARTSETPDSAARPVTVAPGGPSATVTASWP